MLRLRHGGRFRTPQTTPHPQSVGVLLRNLLRTNQENATTVPRSAAGQHQRCESASLELLKSVRWGSPVARSNACLPLRRRRPPSTNTSSGCPSFKGQAHWLQSSLWLKRHLLTRPRRSGLALLRILIEASGDPDVVPVVSLSSARFCADGCQPPRTEVGPLRPQTAMPAWEEGP